jgi:hypothetical protein
VGIKAGPALGERGEFISTSDTLATSEYVVDRLNDYPLAHWLLMDAMADLSGGPLAGLQGDGMFSHSRPRYRGTLISNVGMTRERQTSSSPTGWPISSHSARRSSPTQTRPTSHNERGRVTAVQDKASRAVRMSLTSVRVV